MKRKKELNRKPQFSVGDQIKHSKYGKGTICEIDSRMFPDFSFFYYTKFRDGTKVWLPKFKTEKSCEKLIGGA